MFDGGGGGSGAGGGGGGGSQRVWLSLAECQARAGVCARVETKAYQGSRVVAGVPYYVPHSVGRYLNSPSMHTEAWMRDRWSMDDEASRHADRLWRAHRCGGPEAPGDVLCDELRGAFGSR